MLKDKMIQKKYNVHVALICDVCKKEFDFKKHSMEIEEFTRIKFTGGFFSIFGDGETYELDICQHCMKKKLGKFLHKVEPITGEI